MKNEGLERLITTQDGSHTLYNATFNQHYHSLQGSLQESTHIFIELGLRPLLVQKQVTQDLTPIHVFEMGFGTGLNALLTWKLAHEYQIPIVYTGVEAYPITAQEAAVLNYEEVVGHQGLQDLHSAKWNTSHVLSDIFTFTKLEGTLQDIALPNTIDLVYYDAFAPEAQPELWTAEIFKKIASPMSLNGILVTYSSKGIVRRALQEAGFRIEKYPGPGRKREVVKAILERT